jgi:tetratricopeptide (TPR) repeat protein
LQLLPGLPGLPGVAQDNGTSLSADEWPRLRQQLAEQLLEKLGDTGDIATHERSAPYIIQARYIAHVGEDGHSIRLALRTGRHAYVRGAYALARNDEQRAVALAQTLLGEEHPDTLNGMNNLASTLCALGELPAAREMEERVLEACRHVMGEEHPRTLTSMNNLASTLWNMGELPAARDMQARALDICRRMLGDKHPTTLTMAENLRAMGAVSNETNTVPR